MNKAAIKDDAKNEAWMREHFGKPYADLRDANLKVRAEEAENKKRFGKYLNTAQIEHR